MAGIHPKPHEVFTPGSLPLEESNVYAPRRRPESELQRFIDRNQVPLIYGEYGVGKTTLVRRFFRDVEVNDKLVYIPSAADQTLAAIFRYVLERLNYRVEVRQTDSKRVGGGGGFDVLVARVTVEGGGEKTSERELVVASPTDLELLRIMNEAELTLVVDEMHNASGEFRAELANFIKAVKTGNQAFPRIILIGTTFDAERLVHPDPGIDRYVKELSVPLMTDDEARYIVTEGFARLDLSIEDELVNKIVTTAAGAPTIVHSVALDMAENALAHHREGVTEDDYEDAIGKYLRDHGRRLASSYLKAIETVGEKRYRKQVLHAIADVPNDYATLEDIRSRVSVQLGEEVPATSLSGPLRALKSNDHGAILQDVERYEGGARVHNLTAFKDPMMKSFIRFMRELDEQGMLPVDGDFDTNVQSGHL